MTVLFWSRQVRLVRVTGQTGPTLGCTMLLRVLLIFSLFPNLMFFFFWDFRRWHSRILAYWRPQRLVTHITWKFGSRHFLDYIHDEGAIAADLLIIFRKVLDLLPNEITHTELWCPWPLVFHQIPLKECHIRSVAISRG